jgi:hypothetical protein
MESTKGKALKINLDPLFYGTFAEIGAGQEVARQFFQAGAASGTVAKSMSAYDMTFSDAIYGKEAHGRYVCMSRVEKMLDHEFSLLQDRLSKPRGDRTQFFAFADTVATATQFNSKQQAHGWMGIRFQAAPMGEVNEVIVHVKMLDTLALYQQEALGIFGVNLIFAAFYYHTNVDAFLTSLIDHLGKERIEINVIRCKGPLFKQMNNKLLNLDLVKRGYTDAVLFNETGEVVLAADEFYKKNVQIVRGSFRPPTLVNFDIIKSGLDTFATHEKIGKEEITSVAEITMTNLSSAGLEAEDFLARVEMITALKQKVLISNIPQYYKLVEYLNSFKVKKIGLVLGGYNFKQIFDENYHEANGSIFLALGQLFHNNVTVYVYPYKNEIGDESIDLGNISFSDKIQHLVRHLVDSGRLAQIKNFNDKILHIFSRKVLNQIKNCEKGWEESVPEEVAKIIKEKSLYGFDSCKVK